MLRPLSGDRWNFTTAAHLLNRAGFGGTPAEIEKLVKLGPEKAVSHLVNFENIPDETADPEWANLTRPALSDSSLLGVQGKRNAGSSNARSSKRNAST